jgi:very-short-patch-repair endonuclease
VKNKSTLEAVFALQCKAHKLAPVAELQFHPSRKWRFDFAFPDRMVAVEVDGAVWTNGRHTRGSGYIKDCEKYNNAAALGWFVFRFDGGAVTSGEAIKFMLGVLAMDKGVE